VRVKDHRPFPLLLTLALVLSMASIPAHGQEKDGTDQSPIGGLKFIDEVEVTVVNVIAHVTDRGGKPVTTLSKDDFEVFQDGQEREITNFQLITEADYRQLMQTVEIEPTPTAVPGEPSPPRPRPVNIVLYIDNHNLHPLDRNRVLAQMSAFVRDNLRPPVQMMVVSYQRSLEVLQPFTSDPSAVLDALRSVRSYTGGWVDLETTRSGIVELMNRYLEEEGSARGVRARSEQEYQEIYNQIISYAEEEAQSLTFTVEALREIVNSISGMPGKKSIIYISNGLPMVAGLTLFSELANSYQDPGIFTQVTRFDRSDALKSLVATANAQDVTFYTVAAGGLEVSAMTSAEFRSPRDSSSASLGDNNYLDSIRYIADGTGGVSVHNTNDFASGFERVGRDLYTYYSLGYSINTSGADKIHRIRVTLPNHPDHTVRYRRQFVEKSRETQVQDRVLTGLMFDLDDNQMEIDFVSGKPSPAANDRWIVPVRVSVPLANVALLPVGEDYVGRVVLFIASRDTKGRQSDLVRQEHEIRVLAADYERARDRRYALSGNLLMNDGSHRIAVGLLDVLSRQASYSTVQTSVSGG
jgi:VWFA-related protein